MIEQVMATLERIEVEQRQLSRKFDALLVALGATVVEEPVDKLAAGFAEFAEASRQKHAKGRG